MFDSPQDKAGPDQVGKLDQPELDFDSSVNTEPLPDINVDIKPPDLSTGSRETDWLDVTVR